jgi:hypothetical protein
MSDPAFTDPAAAHAHAARLRSAAERVSELALRLDHRVDGLDYHGPAADRLRSATSDRSRRARNLSRELEDLAERLARGAAAS